MKWLPQQDRDVYYCGDIPVGDVTVPADLAGPTAWRLWLTGSAALYEGIAGNHRKARRIVENRFNEFLITADLRPIDRRRLRR